MDKILNVKNTVPIIKKKTVAVKMKASVLGGERVKPPPGDGEQIILGGSTPCIIFKKFESIKTYFYLKFKSCSQRFTTPLRNIL